MNDWVIRIAFILAGFFFMMALASTNLPTMAVNKVAKVMIQWDGGRSEAPTTVGGKRGDIVEEESIIHGGE